MFCKKCGTQMDDSAQVCPSCGTSVEGASAAPATKGQVEPLRLSALICQSVGALFMMIFCFQVMSGIGGVSDMLGLGGISFLVSLLMLCAAAAVVFVPVCLWLIFAGKQGGNTNLANQGQKLLPISILVQLIVESVIYGLVFLALLVVQGNSDIQFVLSAAGLEGGMALLLLGILILAGGCIFLHVVSLKLTKGAAPNMTGAIACFVAGGVHALTLLIFMANNAMDMVTFLLLAGFAAADIIYGIITLQVSKK